jgi:ABC-type antimicrobial peptide transport system permease subunit
VLDVSVTSPPQPTVYFPWAQNNNFGVPVALVIRTSQEPEAVIPGVREALKQIDASLPLRKVQPLDVFIRESTAPERFRTMVIGLIGLLGLALAGIGIAGVTYRGVVDRRKDFAVRLALGAEPIGVIRLVMLESVGNLIIGSVAGLAAGAGVSLLLAHWLQHVGSLDATSTAIATGAIATVSMSAALVPALRLRRIHPAEVLRS